jgi:hypothetical protein
VCPALFSRTLPGTIVIDVAANAVTSIRPFLEIFLVILYLLFISVVLVLPDLWSIIGQ